MTIENFDNLTNFLNNFTDIQLTVLKGKIEEEQNSRNEKKIQEYYNRIADLFDEIRENGFEIYYCDSDNRLLNEDVTIDISEE